MPRPLWILPLAPRDLVRASLLCLAMALGFCIVLERYWRFFHLDTPGSRAGLLFFVLPASFLSATLASLAFTVAMRTRYAPRALATWGGLVLVALLFAGLFAIELHHSREARSGEGANGGDLAPFFRSLVRLH